MFLDEDRLSKFLEKIQPGPNGCWNWIACRDANGYGRFGLGTGIVKGAHRVSYQHFKGPIPENLVIDHLCRNTSCVNPDHLEAVTHRENTIRGFNPPANQLRQTECHNGHPFDEKNTYFWGKRNMRGCRICRLQALRNFYARKRAKAS